ncbi:MAG: zinc ribbon domain-containing protein [Prevotella sp.]|nr:zinc ribbon domain-containing protein [Prevotella sp.]
MMCRLLRKLTALSFIIYHLLFSVALTSCYRQPSPTPDGWVPTAEQVDSVSFYTTHHYTQNYNFVVTADSLPLIIQQPGEAIGGMLVDTIRVHRDERIVVADIATFASDTIDSVWVQVARDQLTMGWLHEGDLLAAVAPDNPVSRFIDFFSDSHLLIMLAVVVLCLALYVVRRLYRRQAPIVHLRDIPSAYPTLMCLLVAVAAVVYSTIQLADPESWRHYYYHPSLNPFALPVHLGVFLAIVWALVVVGAATLYDVLRLLSPGQALLYLLGLAAVCSVCYVVFSVSTLFYVGYPLLVAYVIFALHRYFRHSRPRYACGQCGLPLRSKGRCPRCGSMNV